MDETKDQLTNDEQRLLIMCVVQGPTNLDGLDFDVEAFTLQRRGFLVLAKIGKAWHAVHTPDGFHAVARIA